MSARPAPGLVYRVSVPGCATRRGSEASALPAGAEFSESFRVLAVLPTIACPGSLARIRAHVPGTAPS